MDTNTRHEEAEVGGANTWNNSRKSVSTQTNLTGSVLRQTFEKYRRDKKILQQRVGRKNRRINTLQSMLQMLKKHNVTDNGELGNALQNNFNRVPFELYENELKNSNRGKAGRRFSENIKTFCLTLYFYSSRAYRFIQK